MDFIDQIRQLAAPIPRQLEHIHTEEASKIALIAPFIRALGYETTDPTEVVPEFTADVGQKKGEKVDFAVMVSGKPAILFECKWSGVDLDQEHAAQLRRYVNTTEARLGVLTNGVRYQFFCDIDKPNVMDARPFFELDMLDIEEDLVEELKKFTKERFNLDDIVTTASELKYTREVKRILADESADPSDEFVTFLAKQVYGGRLTQPVKERFSLITRTAFHQLINDRINDRLKSALSDQPPPPLRVPSELDKGGMTTSDGTPPESVLVTSPEEIEGYYIVKGILRGSVDPNRVFMRDRKLFCSILLDDTQRKPICRLWFNGDQKYVGLFDEDGNERKELVTNLDGIYGFEEQLRDRVVQMESVGTPRRSSTEAVTSTDQD